MVSTFFKLFESAKPAYPAVPGYVIEERAAKFMPPPTFYGTGVKFIVRLFGMFNPPAVLLTELSADGDY